MYTCKHVILIGLINSCIARQDPLGGTSQKRENQGMSLGAQICQPDIEGRELDLQNGGDRNQFGRT